MGGFKDVVVVLAVFVVADAALAVVAAAAGTLHHGALGTNKESQQQQLQHLMLLLVLWLSLLPLLVLNHADFSVVQFHLNSRRAKWQTKADTRRSLQRDGSDAAREDATSTSGNVQSSECT